MIIHSFSEYRMASWGGITMPEPGADQTVVSQAWLDEHIRKRGPLGAVYPRIVFGMEGDTPSFLYLIPNGLGSSEHPDWGSWGGRYGQATVSRWRGAFQNDFAARMDWSVHPQFADANHPPEVRLNGIAGQAPVEITACAGEDLRLSAAGSSDPDHQILRYRWWQYREPSGYGGPTLQLSAEEGAETVVSVRSWVHYSSLPLAASYPLHVMLEVTDTGSPALTRYRRAVINVLAGGVHAGKTCPTPVIRVPRQFTDEADGAAAAAAGSPAAELARLPR
jgi:hypothetical protein